MATLHTFVVTSNYYNPGPADPTVYITGTVDGRGPYTVTVWLSAYQYAQNNGGVPALETLVAPLLYAADQAANPPPPAPPVNQVTGTFTYSL